MEHDVQQNCFIVSFLSLTLKGFFLPHQTHFLSNQQLETTLSVIILLKTHKVSHNAVHSHTSPPFTISRIIISQFSFPAV